MLFLKRGGIAAHKDTPDAPIKLISDPYQFGGMICIDAKPILKGKRKLGLPMMIRVENVVEHAPLMEGKK